MPLRRADHANSSHPHRLAPQSPKDVRPDRLIDLHGLRVLVGFRPRVEDPVDDVERQERQRKTLPRQLVDTSSSSFAGLRVSAGRLGRRRRAAGGLFRLAGWRRTQLKQMQPSVVKEPAPILYRRIYSVSTFGIKTLSFIVNNQIVPSNSTGNVKI